MEVRYLGLAGAVALLLIASCAPRSTPAHPLEGRKAPLFTATLLDGSPFDLAEHVGKDVIILDFWATWCGPCRQALPTLSEVASAYEDRGVKLFAVDLQESATDVKMYLEQSGLPLTVVMDTDGAIASAYHAEAIPQTVIIDRQGNIHKVHVGTSPNLRSELTSELDQLLSPTARRQAAPQGRVAVAVP